MVGVLLVAYTALALGVLLALGGFVAKHRQHPYQNHLLHTGVVSILIGISLVLVFLVAFR